MGSYFGDPGNRDEDSIGTLTRMLPIFHEVRNRDLQDFKDKANFQNELPIRQERMRLLSGADANQRTNTTPTTGSMPANPNVNTVMKEDLSPMDKANLQLKRNDQNIDLQKLKQSGKIGEERIGIQRSQEQLNELKNENIHQNKMSDQQRKVDEATNKLQLAYDRLQQQGDNANAHIEFNKAQMAATNARHELDIAQRQKEHDDLKGLHEAQVNHLNAQIEELKNPKSTVKQTDVNAEGTKKTETTTKGKPDKSFNSNTTIKMIDPKTGNTHMVPFNEQDNAKTKYGLQSIGPRQ